MKKLEWWQTPEVKARSKAYKKKYNQSPEIKKKNRERMNNYYKDNPEFREKKRVRDKEYYQKNKKSILERIKRNQTKRGK